MEFRTHSSWIELDVEVPQDAPCRRYFSFDVFVDGFCVGHMKNFAEQIQSEEAVFGRYELGQFRQRFSLGSGKKQ